ncbi:olfactory receptor 1D2-like [Osmerus mordax]|uniref:olfactory receptor 1D2-like n=1 Tax=Osmerus mordax TaxID=8014 RepID=UPI0035103698
MTFSDNASTVTWFTLSGFDEMMEHRATFFSLTLLCYYAIILVNVALILTIILDENLHEPMYIFLCNLCISGHFGTTGFYPKFLLDLLSDLQVICHAGCLTQSFVIYCSACADVVILSVMAYDMYVAICRPREYHSVMTKQKVTVLVYYPWLSLFCIFIVALIITTRLRFCGSHIEKLYCANWPIVKLSFSSITESNIIKFMQTCMPHLLSLINVAVALLFVLMYSRFGSSDLSQSFQNFMAVQFFNIP